MEPCIVSVYFHVYQQDATLYNISRLYTFHASFPSIIRSSKAVDIPDAVCTVFELLMMGEKAA
jgi:hypothetical protein